MTSESELAIYSRVERQAEELFAERLQRNYQQTDRMFACLLIIEWIAGIVTAVVFSPRAWAGQVSEVHMHVWAALLLGGAIICIPVFLVFVRPGSALTRHMIAIAQMLFSGLLIHLTGGRIETHFHVFGSLAFLSLYRDWRVLITASLVVAADHVLRGIFFPISVYGVTAIQPLRWVEHGWWVVFEVVVLIGANIMQVSEMKAIALKQAQVEGSQARVEQVEERLRQARTGLEQRSIADTISLGHMNNLVRLLEFPVIGQAKDGTIFGWNEAATKLFGFTNNEIAGKHIKLLVPSRKQDEINDLISAARAGKSVERLETIRLRKDGRQVKVILTRTPIMDEQGQMIGVSELMHEAPELKVEAESVSSAAAALE